MVQRRNRYSWLIIAGISFLLLRPSTVFADQVVIDSTDQFDFASACMKKNEYQQAVYEFKRFIHLFPDDPRVSKARRLVGICLLKDRRFDEARETFLNIVNSEKDPHAVGKALLLTGESYYQQGISTEAAYYLEQVIDKYPYIDLRNMALYRLGWARMQAGRWRDAYETFNKVGKDSMFYASSLELAEQSLKGEDLPRKNPAYAGAMAALVPGLGHAYVSRYRDALVAFVLNGVFIWATVESFDQDHEVLGGILAALEVGWYTGNIYSAVNCAHKYNRRSRDDFRSGLKDQFDLGVFVANRGRVGLALKFRF